MNAFAPYKSRHLRHRLSPRHILSFLAAFHANPIFFQKSTATLSIICKKSNLPGFSWEWGNRHNGFWSFEGSGALKALFTFTIVLVLFRLFWSKNSFFQQCTCAKTHNIGKKKKIAYDKSVDTILAWQLQTDTSRTKGDDSRLMQLSPAVTSSL